MKVMSICGTRPELIKMSSLIKKLDKYTEHIFVHTGQNFDYELNEIFYSDLGLRKPDYFLDAHGTSLGETMAMIITRVEDVLKKEMPDAFVVLGDTNSAIGAYVAKRMKIPVFHLEAGNRCFDDNVPEEINRRMIDHISDINLVYTENQRHYLIEEGLHPGRIFVSGSPMLEVFQDVWFDNGETDILKELDVASKDYFLVSIHRDENTEIEGNFEELMRTLNAIAEKYDKKVIVSTHPRTKAKLDKREHTFENAIDNRIVFHKPFGFFDYLTLQMNALCVITDSGTVSEESTLLGFPAITIRNAIERPEALDVGGILMTGVNKDSILNYIDIAIDNDENRIAPYGAPRDYIVSNFSDRVLKIILGYTPYVNKYIWHKR